MWNRDNREKVERDEANARAEEAEKRHRADMADQVGAGDFFCVGIQDCFIYYHFK